MPRGTVEAARGLLENFQNLANPKETGANQVEIREFTHGSNKVRGLGAVTKIQQGTAVVTVPSEYTIAADDVRGERFDDGQLFLSKSVMDEKTKLGLWLAEKKHEWLENPAHELTPKERYWRDAINAYPTLDDYTSRGVPLAASDEDLNHLADVPFIGKRARWASGAHQRLARAQEIYNSAVRRRPADGHEVLNWEDALWGRTLASTGSFGARGMCGGGMVAPIADLINHSDNFNAYFNCDHGELKILSTRDIQPGEEVTIAYKDISPDLFQFYGIVEHLGAPQYLPDDMCHAIRDAHLEQGTSPVEKTAEKFVEMACAATPPEPQAGTAAAASEPANRAIEAPVAMPLPKIAMATLTPLLSLLEPFALFPSMVQLVAGRKVIDPLQPAGASCPASRTDFL